MTTFLGVCLVVAVLMLVDARTEIHCLRTENHFLRKEPPNAE